ncbi:MAG: acetamidase/formamidase family protein [Catenisphaera adipataccumulans]|jgi:amidase|uniref:acetamidase/formamidase family protein n=1 Tax=Catenisphaera adipataccumulans TaxID=700500 RepID=UPI003D91E2DD
MKELQDQDVVYEISRKNSPVVHADDGELVLFHTQDCYKNMVTNENAAMSEQFPDETPNNPATGPVYINGAQPGDVVAVEILDIRVQDHGVVENGHNHYPLAADQERIRILPIHNNTVTFHDVTWRLEPMIGVIGMPADNDEPMPTMCVFNGGGNMDNRRITKGATVYLPVRVEGGLLALGDLHATMGDGEVCGTGLEVAGEVLVRLHLIKNFALNWPVIETKTRWYVNTNGKTTDEAIRAGYKEMRRLLANAYGWDDADAAIYMTLRGYVEACQACLVPGGGGNSMRVGTPKLADHKPLITKEN